MPVSAETMHDNMKPHELMRQICEVLHSFDPKGDPIWPLRQIRNFVLDYNRAMSRMRQIKQGYEQNEAYRWLKRHGGSDGMYEAQTVLMVQDEKVSLVIQRIKDEYRVRAGQDEAMEVPDETQIEEPGWTEPGLCEGTEA